MRILATTDGSKEATAALRAACRLLSKADRQVDVLYVAPEARLPKSSGIAQRAFQHRAAAEARRILECAKRVLADEGVDALTLSEIGSPAGVIMTEAEDYDVTVIGAKGCGMHANVGLGPVASRIVEHADGCVLVGREPPQDRQARILVPVDGSAGSKHALEALSDFFDLESADITLLHVLETVWLPETREEESLGDGDIDFAQATQVIAELRHEAEHLLADAQARVAERHPGLTTTIREGVPANEILSEADQGDYDLVVVGASEANDMKHSVLGSVSSKVAWNAPCSVLVVRVPE
jgi:nucleotide-binding universal stress UspA family protein